MRRIVGTAVLLALAATHLRGQETAVAVGPFRLNVFRADEGLPSNAVSNIQESADGYLWMATPLGLTRFDGMQFTTFDHLNTDALRARIDNTLKPLLEDSHGVLWIASNRELVRYRNGTFARDAALDGTVLNESIAGLTEDSTGALWALTDVGRLLRRHGDRLVPVHMRGLPAGQGTAIATGPDGMLWLGFLGAGVARVHPGDSTVTWVSRRDGLPDDNVLAILETRGSVWVATVTGVARAVGDHLVPVPLGHHDVPVEFASLAEDRSGGLWIGTHGDGVYRYADGVAAHVTVRDGLLSNDEVEGVSVDAEGTVWVGTRHGLNRFRPVRLSPMTPRNGLPTAEPGAIAIDSNGALWMAAETGGLYRRASADSGAFVPVTPTLLHHDVVLSLAAGRDGTVWVGTPRSGLLRYRDGDWRSYPVHGIVRAALEDERGRVWLATSAGLVRLADGALTTYSVRDGLDSPSLFCLADDRRGAIWVGTARGISRVDVSGIKNFSAADGLGDGHVITLHTDAGGTVWAGTTDGLTRVSGDRMVTLRSENGIVPDYVAAIGEDATGHLWLAGFEGLERVSIAALNAVADSVARGLPARGQNAITLLPADGLPSPEVAALAREPVARAQTGRLWVSMEGGIVSFDPAAIHGASAPPIVHLERVRLDGVAQPLDAPLSIGPGAQRLEFRYTGISLGYGPRVRFRYRLDGFDTDWVDAGPTRVVSYTRLAPGRYRFRVMARAADGPWSAATGGFGFRVLPPFYRTWWFLAGTTLLLVAALVTAFRARTAVLEARFAGVLAERTRLAREIHDTLLQGFTGVALALRAARRQLNDGSSGALAEVQTLAQHTLADARRAVWDLRAPALDQPQFPAALESTARQTVAGSPVEIEFVVSGRPRPLPADTEGALLRVCQEALANCVKHASAPRAWVIVAFARRGVRLIVRDEGKGFVVDPSGRSYAGHWGLLGMRERVEQVGGRLSLTSAPDRGTEVSVFARYGRTTPPERGGAVTPHSGNS